jgi:PD-(D/E)XK nuclease superfamily
MDSRFRGNDGWGVGRRSPLQAPRSSSLPVVYKSLRLDCGYRLDIIIQHQVILELKTVERLTPIHEARMLTYMKLSELVPVSCLISIPPCSRTASGALCCKSPIPHCLAASPVDSKDRQISIALQPPAAPDWPTELAPSGLAFGSRVPDKIGWRRPWRMELRHRVAPR